MLPTDRYGMRKKLFNAKLLRLKTRRILIALCDVSVLEQVEKINNNKIKRRDY